MKKLVFTILLFLAVLSAVVLAADGWHGLVVHVVDGDTLTVSREGLPVEVRLYGVDEVAPSFAIVIASR